MKKCSINRRHEPIQVFKDNDLKYKVVVNPQKKIKIGLQLREDTTFLARYLSGLTSFTLYSAKKFHRYIKLFKSLYKSG